MTKPNVAIIVLHWGDPADTLALLASLTKVSYEAYHVFLVDQTRTLAYKAHGKVELIVPDDNLGYSGGNNLVLERIRDQDYTYALLLNNDTLVEPDFLERMVAAMETTPDAAAAGPTILYGGSDEIWFGGGEYMPSKGAVQHLRLRQRFDLTQESEEALPTSFITGCSMLVRMSTIVKIGALDDRYFVYWEDADWCVRAQAAGQSLLYVPRSVVYHNVSSGLSVNSPQYLYYIFRNNLLFIRKHVAGLSRVTAWLEFALKMTKEVVKVFVRYRSDYGKYFGLMARALSDNAKRRYGKL